MNFSYFSNLKKYLEIYSICLLEICDELCVYDLEIISFVIMKFFHSFKLHMVYFLKFNLDFFHSHLLSCI